MGWVGGAQEGQLGLLGGRPSAFSSWAQARFLHNLGKVSCGEEGLGGWGRLASIFPLFFDLILGDSLGREACLRFWSRNEGRSQLVT